MQLTLRHVADHCYAILALGVGVRLIDDLRFRVSIYVTIRGFRGPLKLPPRGS